MLYQVYYSSKYEYFTYTRLWKMHWQVPSLFTCRTPQTFVDRPWNKSLVPTQKRTKTWERGLNRNTICIWYVEVWDYPSAGGFKKNEKKNKAKHGPDVKKSLHKLRGLQIANPAISEAYENRAHVFDTYCEPVAPVMQLLLPGTVYDYYTSNLILVSTGGGLWTLSSGRGTYQYIFYLITLQ